jgi:RNA exonuclease 4
MSASAAKSTTTSQASSSKSAAQLTKAVAIDCEMVGVGENGKEDMVARVSLVNQMCERIYDKHVQPTEPVVDYRTKVSGIRPGDLKKQNATPFETVQREVADLIKNRILVGHALHNDLRVLYLSHPKKLIRDTQKCRVFRHMSPSIGSLCSLKNLAQILLGISIQEGEHDSVQDAQVAMRLYTLHKKQWEADFKSKQNK